MINKKDLIVVATVLLVAMGSAVAAVLTPSPPQPQSVACKPGFVHLTKNFCVLAPLGAQRD